MSNLQNYEPQRVLKWFYEINQIPRGSGNEKAISDYLLKFAQERNLEVEQDEALNIIVRKAGSPGYENAPRVAIQGHMDMVPEKALDSDHDFLKDPIEMAVDGDWLHANKTTLGADDGIAVAYAMALLDADDIPHPPLEIIITTSEETGMDGAQALKPGDIQSAYLLNIDSETEGIFTLGCAGGADFSTSFDLEREELAEPVASYEIQITGLKGGHSGQTIDQGRGNAIKILARILYQLKKQDPALRLASFEGGSKHNAIPSSATASFVSAHSEVSQVVSSEFAKIRAELQGVDNDVDCLLQSVQASSLISVEASAHIIDYLFVVPHGVQSMSPLMEGLVQTSLNVAIAKEVDGQFNVQHSLRSAVNSSKEELLERLFCLAEHFGAKAESAGAYPAWEFNPESSLIDRVKEVYKKSCGEEPEIVAIHAGLECGLLGEIAPDTEMISFGPNMEDIHTPRERLSLSSTERVWNFLLELLASFK